MSAKKKRDRRGDEFGILEPPPEGGNMLRDDLVSIRWARLQIESTAREAADMFDGDEEPADGDDYAARMDDTARSLDHAAALWKAFRLLWRAKPRRVTSGEVIDAADLFITGKHGAIEEIVDGLLAGKFSDVERDADGFVAHVWD